MSGYLILFKYSAEAYRGLLKEKASGREESIRKSYGSTGGKVEAVYWPTNGEFTGAVVAQWPDNVSGAAVAASAEASGALKELRTIELLTTAEMDAALAKPVTYRAPGG